MRSSTLLLASFLAVVPGTPITATPTRLESAGEADASIKDSFTLSNGHTYNFKGCISPGSLTVPANPPPSSMTVENCAFQCDDAGSSQAGVQDGDACFCNNGANVGQISLTQCQQKTCAGNIGECCGSSTSQVYYQWDH